MAVKGVLQLGSCTSCPVIDYAVIDRHAALIHQFFLMVRTQQIRDVPPSIGEDNVLYKMGSLEADHPGALPFLLCTGRCRKAPRKPTNEKLRYMGPPRKPINLVLGIYKKK